MKQKKFSKKISLRKETISDLSSNQLDSVRGGKPVTYLCTIYSPWGQTCYEPCEQTLYFCTFPVGGCE